MRPGTHNRDLPARYSGAQPNGVLLPVKAAILILRFHQCLIVSPKDIHSGNFIHTEKAIIWNGYIHIYMYIYVCNKI